MRHQPLSAAALLLVLWPALSAAVDDAGEGAAASAATGTESPAPAEPSVAPAPGWPAYPMPGYPMLPPMPPVPPSPWAGDAGTPGYPPLDAYPPRFPAAPYGVPPRMERGGPAFSASRVGMRLSRQVTREAYVLTVQVGAGQAPGVQVTPLVGPRGQALAVVQTSESQVIQEDSFDDGRGVSRSFSFSRGSASRRLPLPPDADLAGMTREDRGDTVVITIPRHRPADPLADPRTNQAPR